MARVKTLEGEVDQLKGQLELIKQYGFEPAALELLQRLETAKTQRTVVVKEQVHSLIKFQLVVISVVLSLAL